MIERVVIVKQSAKSLVERVNRSIWPFRVQLHGAGEHRLIAFGILRPVENIPALPQALLQDAWKLVFGVVRD